ncbi:unnamed protein product [Peniophora sp. CBMAI 1063]|nr:unnamed protein product [Peniophora sp. CBMAI 1063]
MVPGYPIIPVTAFVSSALLLLVLISSAERRSWNFGLTVLCVCVFVENFCGAIETVMWKDNADVKLYTFCDFISRWQMFTGVVKPACTLVITRKLHKVASMEGLRSTDGQKRFDLWFDLTILLFIPAIIAGPIYYVVQGVRFVVIEGYGCTNNLDGSFLAIILIQLCRLFFPLYSISVYCPRIFWTFYKHNKSVNRFLNTNGHVSRSRFFRVLAIGSLDIFITLPQGILVTVDMCISVALGPRKEGSGSRWYGGWEGVHSRWEPYSVSLQELWASRFSTYTVNYSAWTSIVLAFALFALFGLTKAARASYWRIVCAIARVTGYDLAQRVTERPMLSSMAFGRRTQRTQTGGIGTQVTVIVDVASAVRRDAEAGPVPLQHPRASWDASEHSDVSTLPSYRTSIDSHKTPAPSYDGHENVTASSGSSTPTYHANPIDPSSHV